MMLSNNVTFAWLISPAWRYPWRMPVVLYVLVTAPLTAASPVAHSLLHPLWKGKSLHGANIFIKGRSTRPGIECWQKFPKLLVFLVGKQKEVSANAKPGKLHCRIKCSINTSPQSVRQNVLRAPSSCWGVLESGMTTVSIEGPQLPGWFPAKLLMSLKEQEPNWATVNEL